MASRRVVNVDSGSSGSLSSRFANIEKSAPKQKPATRAVQAVPTSRPVSGGVNKRGQQSPRGGARNGPAKSLAAVRGGAAPRGRPSGRGAPRGGALRGGSVRGGGRGGRGRGGRGGARGGKKAVSKEDLDKELDNYMLKDEKIGQDLLDKELADYMASRGNDSNGEDQATETN